MEGQQEGDRLSGRPEKEKKTMIEIKESTLCNACKSDIRKEPDAEFMQIYFGDGHSGTQLHLCTKCIRKLIAEIVFALNKTGGNDNEK